MTRTVIIVATIVGLLILLFTDRYLVAMLVKPLDRIRQQFRQIAQGDLSQPIEPFGRNCVGQLVPLLSAMQDSLREAVSTSAPAVKISGAGRRRFPAVTTISPPAPKSRRRHWKRRQPAWNS